MSLKRLRYRDLVALGIIRNRPTLQNWIKDRGFPAGRLLGPNSRTWGEDEVADWLARRPTESKPAPPPPGPGKRRGRPPKAPRPEMGA
jgi:predicted DNA-binding transcriptional regulator AlpA